MRNYAKGGGVKTLSPPVIGDRTVIFVLSWVIHPTVLLYLSLLPGPMMTSNSKIQPPSRGFIVLPYVRDQGVRKKVLVSDGAAISCNLPEGSLPVSPPPLREPPKCPWSGGASLFVITQEIEFRIGQSYSFWGIVTTSIVVLALMTHIRSRGHSRRKSRVSCLFEFEFEFEFGVVVW